MRNVLLKRVVAEFSCLIRIHDAIWKIGSIGLRYGYFYQRFLCHGPFLIVESKRVEAMPRPSVLKSACQFIRDQAKAKRLGEWLF